MLVFKAESMSPGRRVVFPGAVVGLLSGLAVTSLAYLAELIAGAAFFPFPIFEQVGRILPGALLSFGIEEMIGVVRSADVGPTANVAKFVEKVLAVVFFLGYATLAGGMLGALGRRSRAVIVGCGIVVGAVPLVMAGWGGALAGAVGTLWLVSLLVGWGLIAALCVVVIAKPISMFAPRRRFLGLLAAGAAGLTTLAAGFALFGSRRAPSPRGVAPEALVSSTSGAAASPSANALQARIDPAPGTRAELTSNANFYRVDINLRPPRLSEAEWRLEVQGLVSRPLSLSLDQLRRRPAVSQAITLSCISNPIGGDLISTAVFTGVPLREILGEARMLPDAAAVYIESADGFHESVALGNALDERTLLVYEMNGVPLPVAHGFPLRIYIPDRYGMKQPKWIERLEVVDRERPGYWVTRGWSRSAIVQTTSVIDPIHLDDPSRSDRLPIGGIAFAGARGIQRVQVQVDDGPWRDARLRAPALSALTWVQWRYDWNMRSGRHRFRVRAYDGSGALQPTDPRSPHPAGATGVHALTLDL